MAAPSNTVWGSIVGGYGRIGISITMSSTNTQTTRTIDVWFWSKYSVSDSNNKYYYNHDATSATTLQGSRTINTTVASGSGWSTSNQVLLGSATATVNRGTSAKTYYVAAKLAEVDRVGGTMTVVTSYTIPALAKYTVSYNANGGSGAPGSQTKVYGTTLKLSSTKPTRTGYNFQGWATSSSGSVAYAAGANYTANASVTLYAKWALKTYTVSYNANGGSGAPGSQTKTHGTTLTLSSTKPTRSGYNFKGWATSASGSVSYAAGAKYTANSAVTLYAVWELAYTAPRITSLSINRCTSSGTTDEKGTYAQVKFNWATDKTVSSIKIEWKTSSASSYGNSTSVSGSGTSGSVNTIIGANALSTETTYNIRVTVADASGNSSYVKSLPGMFFTMDFLNGGKGVAFGKPAEKANTVDYAMSILVRNGYSVSKEFSDGTTAGMLSSKKITDGGGGGTNYHGIFKPDEDDSGWIRTPKSGLLPYQSAGYSSLGSSAWPFTNLYANNVYVGGRNIKTNNILWSGGLYMTASQTATLSESVTDQIHGIALVFSRYSDSTVRDYQFQTFYVPKRKVQSHPGGGQSFLLTSDGSFSVMAAKYLYINNTSIVGNDINNKTGTGTSGIKYENNGYVLRYVIGV